MPEKMTLDQLAALYYSYQDIVPSAWLAPLQLPGVCAFWAANQFDESCNWYDLASKTNMLAATGCTFAADVKTPPTTWPGALVPYVELDGTNDYFSIADNVTLSITGAMTIGVWFYIDTGGEKDVNGLWGKGNQAGDTLSYYGYVDDDDLLSVGITSNGDADTTNFYTQISGATAGTWHLAVMRFTPSAAIEGYLMGENSAGNYTSPPASIYDSARNLLLGCTLETAAYGLDGRIAQAWVCQAAVDSNVLDWLYKVQAPLFGRAV